MCLVYGDCDFNTLDYAQAAGGPRALPPPTACYPPPLVHRVNYFFLVVGGVVVVNTWRDEDRSTHTRNTHKYTRTVIAPRILSRRQSKLRPLASPGRRFSELRQGGSKLSYVQYQVHVVQVNLSPDACWHCAMICG